MKKIYIIIALIFFLMIGFAFYWYEYRPTKIKERCSADAHFDAANRLDLSAFREKSRQEFINNYYNDCLMRFGLK